MVNRITKGSDGKYSIKYRDGKVRRFELLEGSRRQVWNETAYRTSGKLTREDLLLNKHGRIVSKSKHDLEKKRKNLQKHGYFTQKGKFGFVKKASATKKKRRRSKKK